MGAAAPSRKLHRARSPLCPPACPSHGSHCRLQPLLPLFFAEKSLPLQQCYGGVYVAAS